MTFFSFLDHLNFIEDDSSRYEVGVSDEGFSYLDLVSEKKARRLTFEEKQHRETSAALDGSTRARGQSNITQIEALDHDEVCFDTDLMAILRDIQERRRKVSVFPWAVGAACVLLTGWLVFVFSLPYAAVALVLSAIVIVPGTAFALVNAWYFDRSRKDVHFAYKITGEGEVAFSRLNRALQAVSQSGQTLLLAGRRHFADTRYTGGATSLPDFERFKCGRGRPPLLELDFDVWHMRAFSKDLYFMPDHMLVFDGARIGGVDYTKLRITTGTEVSQARGPAIVTRDAKVVGRTHRFVNNDGSPDRRFNNNTEVPLIEYGLLSLSGSGLDVSLFLTAQRSAFDVPGEFSQLRELAAKPVRKVAAERRAEAAMRRKARQDEVFGVVLDAMGCVMFADGQASKSERDQVQQLMQRIRAPWSEAEVEARMREFRNRAKQDGLNVIVRDVCSRASSIRDPRQKAALAKCLEQVAAADGTTDAKELAIREQILAALSND